MPPAQVRTNLETYLIPPAELEEELRRGRLPDSVHVQHPEWTGDGFVPAREIAALRDALAAEEARMCAQLRRFGVPWVTVGVCGVLGLVGVGQAVSWVLGQGDAVVDVTAVGFARTVMDRAFWTPFTAALTHVSVGHLAVNLPLLAYSGYRTERVLGAWGASSVFAMALLWSSIAILMWSDLPVVGASTLAYGVWGAQIAIGFRHSALVPAELQSRYGVGNLVLFLPLAFMSLFDGPGVSLVGHAGGLVGGVLAVVGSRPFHPSRGKSLAAAALGLTTLLPWSPAWVWAGTWSPVEISDGISLSLPSRWLEHRGRWEGMPAWSSGDRYPVFAGTFVGDGPGLETGLGRPAQEPAAREQALWGQWLHGPAEASAIEGIPLGFLVTVANDEEPWVIVERIVEHGGLRTRAGYLLPASCTAQDACAARRAMGDAILDTLALAPVNAQ